MQMHESKVNNIKSSTSSTSSSSAANKHSNSKLPTNQSSGGTSSAKEQSKKSKNKNLSRDRQHGDDATPAPAMSNLASYSLIDDDHIDDQETINVGRLIIDLESDLEPREQAHNNNVGNNSIPTTCSTTSTTNTLYSSSSSTPFVSNSSSNKSISSNVSPDSGKSVVKSNQKVGKHTNTIPNSSNNSSSNNPSNSVPTSSASTTNNGHASARTVFKSSADERGELKMKITRETKPGKSEHRIIASSNQKSPSSSTTNNNSSDSTIISQLNNCEDSCTSDSALKPSQSSSSISSTKECGTSTSVGTITEPECLGPCEPGTSVTLEGIVWQETDGGILVVNVTWRGKTYVGALLDCTRHDWAPPRLCDSPASDIDSKINKGIRAKRIVTRSNGIGIDEKNLLQTAGKLRNGKGRRILSGSDAASCSKKQRDSSDKSSNEIPTAQTEANASMGAVCSQNISESACTSANIDTTQATCEQNDSISTSKALLDKPGPNSPMLIGCSEPNCSKKYRNMNGLLYHQAHAHSGENESTSVQDDNCSSSTKDKVSETERTETDLEQKDTTPDKADGTRPELSASNKILNITQPQAQKREHERTPSPNLPTKMSNRPPNDISPSMSDGVNVPSPSSSRLSVVKGMDIERRHSSGASGMGPRGDLGRRSPDISVRQPFEPHGQGSSLSYNHPFSSLSKPSSSSSKQQPHPPQQQQQQPPMQPPLPATSEEGMKPSGTSTGPPPAPHQANCYFNSAFLANTFNPYAVPPYFPRTMYDQIVPPTPTSNAAFLTRFINNMHVPPAPESPSRLLSPSMPKNLPFPPFKNEPGVLPPPVSQLSNIPLHNLNSMTNPPLAGVSPNLRMPSQGDPMLPPASQPPFLPPTVGLNPTLRLPGMISPLGPVGGPQVPSLVDDPMAKQFQRRFN